MTFAATGLDLPAMSDAMGSRLIEKMAPEEQTNRPSVDSGGFWHSLDWMKYGPMRCIVRIDVEKPRAQHCWEVKIIRPGNSFHQAFSDSKHGGKRAALLAAKKCRDIELKKRPAMTGYDQAMTLKSTNKSGIAGVRKTVRVVRRGKKKWAYDVWAATGTPKTGERTNTRYFSINKLGNKGARLAAIAQREAWVESLRKSLGARKR